MKCCVRQLLGVEYFDCSYPFVQCSSELFGIISQLCQCYPNLQLRISYYVFPVVYFLLCISSCVFPIMYFQLCISYYVFPVVYFLLCISSCVFPIMYFLFSYFFIMYFKLDMKSNSSTKLK